MPAASPEIHSDRRAVKKARYGSRNRNARAKFRKLLGKELPLKDGRCVIPIGENMAELVTEHPKPLSRVQFEVVFRHISNMMTVFPEKIEKTTKIFEELIE